MGVGVWGALLTHCTFAGDAWPGFPGQHCDLHHLRTQAWSVYTTAFCPPSSKVICPLFSIHRFAKPCAQTAHNCRRRFAEHIAVYLSNAEAVFEELAALGAGGSVGAASRIGGALNGPVKHSGFGRLID